MYRIYDDWTCDELERIKNMLKHELPITYRFASPTDCGGFHVFSHQIQNRIEEDNWIPFPESVLYYDMVKSVFKFCFENNIHFDFIARAAINITTPSKYSPDFHIDHTYPHISLIFSFNDSDGGTILRTEDDEIVVHSKENRVLVFDGLTYHSTLVNKYDHRIIMVVTLSTYESVGI